MEDIEAWELRAAADDFRLSFLMEDSARAVGLLGAAGGDTDNLRKIIDHAIQAEAEAMIAKMKSEPGAP